ncbi:MAG: Ig-like domain-containing protein [Bacteroidota bacterium]
MTINWTGGNGDRTLVLAKEGSAVDAQPTIGVDYTSNTNFGTGDEIGTGNFVIHDDGGSNVTLSGLTGATTYHFALYEYDLAGFCYQLTGAFATSETTACSEPNNSPGSLTFSATNDSQSTLTWSGGDGDQSLILSREGAAVNADPVLGTDYTANSTFGSGDEIGTGNFVVFKGSANSTTVDGLSGATTYHFAIYEFNTAGNCYRLTNPRRNDVTTDCAAPTGQASAITFSNTTATTMEVNWVRGTPSGDGVLVVARRNSPVTFRPSNGDDYSGEVNSNFNAAQNQGGNTRIVFRGAGTSVVVTNLEPSITYHFAVFEYNDASNCYNLVGEAIDQNQTLAGDLNSTISNGSGSSTPLSSLAAPGSRVEVFNFTIEDLGGDNLDTDFSEIVFREIGGQITDLRDLIETVELTNGSDSRTSGVTINQDNIVMTGIPTGNDLGDVNNGTSSTYTLSVSFLNTFGGSLPTTVDGLRLVFSVDESDITVPTGRSGFAPGENANSDETGGGTNNTIAVTATALDFIQQPSNVFVLTAMTPPVTIQAIDSRGNRDLDYTGSVELTSEGTLQSTPSATFSAGLGTYANIIHTVSQTGIRLGSANSSPLLMETGFSNTFNVNGPAQNSDIVADGSFTSPDNIAYINFQENTNITASTSSLEVAGFTIRDGGSGNDGDVFTTELTAIEFDITNGGFIRRAALYGDLDDNGSYETELSEAVPTGNTLIFGSFSITAPDNGSIDFVIRASFSTSVTDNTQFSFQVSNATFEPAGSGAAAANAGAAVSSTSGDNNRIEVIATAQQFTTQPDALELQDAPINPQPVVEAIDANGNQDLDYNGAVTVTSPVTILGAPAAYSTGTLTFSGFTYTSSGDGTITVESGGLSNAVSNTVTVDGTPPTAVINDDHPDNTVRDADNVTITVEFSEAIDDTPGPRISIGSVVTNAVLNQVDADTWNFVWDVPGGVDQSAAITITANDLAGNALSSITAGTAPTTYIIDNTRPTVNTITRLDPSPTSATSVRFQVVFSEPVTGVGSGDFTLDASSGSISIVIGSNDTYVVTATGLGGLNETVGLNLLSASATVSDIAGNTFNNSFTTGETYEVDNTPPIIADLTPQDNLFNYPIDADLTIQFNEDIAIGTGNITLKLISNDNVVETLPVGTTTLSGTDALTINPTADLAEGTGYYIEIDAGAITDVAGNSFSGIFGNATWNFTTFAPQTVASISDVGCVGDDINITGQFLTGITTVRFNGSGGNVNASSFTIVNDNLITATVPFYGAPISSLSGTIFLQKTGGGNPVTDLVTTETIEIGPSQANLTVGTIDNDPVCSSGTVVSSTIKVDIRGGTGPYVVDYGISSVSNYNSGDDITANPNAPGPNVFSPVSVTDANGCQVPIGQLSGSYTVTQNVRSVVEAGGIGGSIDWCPAADGLTIELNTSDLSIAPSLTGAPGVGTVWSTSGDGTFANSTSLTNAEYTIGTNDLLNNSVTLFLSTTNDPAPCELVTDDLVINFVSNSTANPGGQAGVLEVCWDGTDPAVVPLNGSVTGAGVTPQWSVIDRGNGDGSDGSFNDPAISNPLYTFGPDDMDNGFATVRLTPNGGSCGSGTASDLQINLIPIPTNGFISPNNNVCTNDSGILYRVANNSGSTYNWSVQGVTNTFVGDGTSTIIVEWGGTSGAYNVEVVETDLNGCQSLPIVLNVTVNDLPNAEILRPIDRSFEVNATPSILRGGISPDTLDGVFSGPGIFFTNTSGSIDWFFDPGQAEILNSPHNINFTLTDANGCTGEITEQFIVFDGSSTIVIAGTNTVVSQELCEDDEPIQIELNPSSGITVESGANVLFYGFGIRDVDLANNTAVFDPKLAKEQKRDDGEITIFYDQFQSGNRRPLGQQNTFINSKPTPNTNLFLITDSYCEDDMARQLTISNDLGQGQTAIFSSPSHPSAITSGSNLFFFNPANIQFSLENDDPNNDFTPEVIDIEYRYIAETGCDSLISRQVSVVQKPPVPNVNETQVCIVGDEIPQVIAIGVDRTNAVEINGDVIIRWFDRDNDLVFTGNILDQAVLEAVTGTETFFVAQQVNGCLSEGVEVVVERIDSFDFSFDSSCISPGGINFTPDLGTNTSLLGVRWSVDGEIKETKNGMNANDDFNNVFTGAGLYEIKLEILSANGCNDSIVKPVVITNQQTVNNNINYFESFNDNLGGGWVASGINSSWSFGSPGPGNTTISLDANNGSEIWITGLDGPYSKSEESFLFSPCFDLSELDRPLLSFDHWVNTAEGEDGVIVEYSTTGINGTWTRLGNFDNGIQSGINWYNVRDISSNPGDQPVGFYGWSGDSDGWRTSKHSLDDIPATERQEVLFRFSFSSTEGSDAVDKPDGFALDNVFVGNRTRLVLIENFTNVSQAANTLAEAQVLENFPGSTLERVVLNYHTVFPGEDPINDINPAPASARALYYGIDEVPRARLDGSARTDLGDLFSAWGETEYNIRTLDNAPIAIRANIQNDGSLLTIQASFRALQDIAPNAIAHIAIVENNVSISSLGASEVPSGQTVLNHVVREMLPAATGTKFPNQILSGDSVSVKFTWQPTTEIIDPDQVAIVIFLQDEESRTVYQTDYIDNLSLPPLITGLESEFLENGIYLYPNPADQKVTLRFNNPINDEIPVVIYDQFGKTVYERKVLKGSDRVDFNTISFVPGLYHVQLQLSDGAVIQERLIIMHR